MQRCEHNEKITIFCLSEHCEWKQPAGCQKCIKKYHNHITPKLISEPDLLTITQKLSLQSIPKPNSRKIQQSLYSYFTSLKSQLASSLDLMCKSLINLIGSPYLTENHLLTVYKRLKNKQYKRLQQKQFKKFYETALKINPPQVSKQQTKLYKEQLKNTHQLINNLQTILSSYSTLFKPINQHFCHQKSPFETLNSTLKLTIDHADLSINISQFHEKQMEKNKAQRAQKLQKTHINQTKKHKNQYDSMLSTQYSSRLPSTAKQKNFRTPELSKNSQISPTPSKIKEDIFYESANHKFGVKDFGTLQKLQKSDSQEIKNKRPLSLDKKLAMNLSVQIPLNSERIKNDTFFIEQIKNQNDKVQRHKITFLQKPESIFNEICSQNSTKKSQQSTPGPLEKNSLRENQISVRKEQLIEMMKNQSAVIKIGQRDKEKQKEKERACLKNEMKMPNNSIVVKPKTEQSSFEFNYRKNSSSFYGERSLQKNLEPKKSTELNNYMSLTSHIQSHSAKTPVKKSPIKQMPDVAQDVEKSSQGSLEVVKKIIPKKNMNAHPKLPIEEFEQKPKELAQSRLIIVPTGSKFQSDKSEECDSPLLKKKISNNAKKDEKLTPKYPKKQTYQHTPGSKEEKPEVKQSQEKSLNLLIKSIHLPPTQAIPTLEAALKQAPNNLSAAQYLSFLYLEMHKPKEALQTCNIILDRFEIITKENEELLINLENNKAAALNMLGRYSEAIVLLQRCLKCKEKDTLLKNLGDAYYFGSNYEKAVFYYEKTVKISPQYDEAYFNMAVCLYLQNNFHNALQSVVKALEASPKNPDYLELKTNVELKITQSSSL